MRTLALKAVPGAAIIILLVLSCGDGTFRLKSHRFGQDISRQGGITNGSTSFTFPVYRRGGARRDLFNYLYFKGDTLCFSFAFSRGLEGRTPAAVFIDPATGRRFNAERLEVSGDTVWGFSLIGSLLEKFHGDRPDDPIPQGAFCCKDIPFGVEVTVPGKEGDAVTVRKDSSFRIEYR